ncbi:MAG: hypothetical protein MUC36_25860 [Planctomycetes bacterium]|jgi:hypothetical protein|nr:hypothetical protein [Planctomycetota bacterium]
MFVRSVASFCLAVPVVAQTITLAEGSPTSLQILSVPESNPNAPDAVLLQAVELLPIEITARTLAQEVDVTRSRRIVRNGLERIELPGGGRLFRYRRSGGLFWGFLHIAADGAPRVVLERPGTGAQLLDPFADRIAVAPNGQHAAIAGQNGGLFVVRLDGGVFASTGRPDRQAVSGGGDVGAPSVLVGDAVVWFQDNSNHVFRCDLADGGVPVSVSPPPVPNADLKEEMVAARDGSRVVFLYGPQQQVRLYLATSTGGAAIALPPLPSKYEEPGYLPEGPGEPAMLMNDAGTRLFFVDADVRDELALLDLDGVLPTLRMTESTIFQPYIGTHILPRFLADKLVVAVGDPAAMDWFRAELAPAAGTVVNLTGTGSVQQPFPSGTIDPRQSGKVGARMWITEQQAGGLALRDLDPLTGAGGIVQQGLLAPPIPGSSAVGVPDLVVPSPSGDSLHLGGSGLLLAATPAGIELTPPAHGPLFASTWVHLASNFGFAAFYQANGTLLTGPLEFDLQQLVATPIGGFVAIGSPVRYLAPGILVVLNRPVASMRRCLSGAGA